MLIFEEEGIKKSFKIIINTKGIIIKTKGLLSSSYNEVYSKLFHEVNSITLNNKILQTEFVIDNITLYFNDNDEANIVSKLIALGKSNTEILLRYIGVDTQHVDICDIELDDLTSDSDDVPAPSETKPQTETTSSDDADLDDLDDLLKDI